MYPSKNLWIWGHPTNSLYNCFGIKQQSSMSPAEGAKYLGADNVFYVPMGNSTDIDAENERMKGLKTVGWSIEKISMADEFLQHAKKTDNVKIGIFDDFFNEENKSNNYLNYSHELLSEIRKKFHEAGIEMWMVLYTKQFNMDIAPLISEFDGVSMWFWNESDVDNFDERINKFFSLTEGKKRLLGCYLYNFGDEKPSEPQKVVFQLKRHLQYLKEGKIDGTILHTNAVADMGFEAVEAAKKFIKE